jgi:hypothetical protein
MSSIVRYTANGSTDSFSIPFPYIADSHVVVTSGSAAMTLGAHYDIVGANVVFRPAFKPAGGVIVDIRRNTPVSPLVSYQNGTVLTADDLNTATKQAIFAVEEVKDYYEYALNGGFNRIIDGGYVSAQEAIDAAVQEVLNSALVAEFQTRIGDIDTNAESILSHNLELISLQDQIDALATIDGVGIATLIANEEAARISGDTALAETLALIGAKSGDNLSFILDLAKVKVSPTESLATRLTTLASSDAANSAAIAAEQITRANGDSSLASSITSLTSTVNGHTSSLSTQQTVLNGLAASYVVKTDVNGKVAGFGLYNEAGASQFVIAADKFAVYSGGTTKVPFLISGGVCYMQNVVIQDALIQNLTVGKLTSGTLGAAITGGTAGVIKFGQTAYDTGTGYWLGYTGGAYKLSIGSSSKALLWDGTNLTLRGADLTLSGGGNTRYLGTDVNGAYIDWFGPTGATVNDENAKYFVKKDGTAMFTGRIRGEFEPKAWVGWDGSGAVAIIKDRYNVASVTRLQQGQYQINFLEPLANANYVIAGTCQDGSAVRILVVDARSTTSVTISARGREDGGRKDCDYISVILFGSNVPVASGGSNHTVPGGGWGGGTRGGGVEP